MVIRASIGVLTLALVVGGCAHTPYVTLGHYLPSSEVEIKVDRVLTCDANNNIVEVSDVKSTTKYVADYSQWKLLPISQIDSAFADADMTFEFYDDGRLKGVNTSTTGKGEDILKSAMSLVGMFGFEATRKPDKPACDIIKKLAGKADALTVSYTKNILIEDQMRTWLDPMLSSALAVKELQAHIGDVCAVITKKGPVQTPDMAEGQSGMVIDLKQPGIALVIVKTGFEPDTCEGDFLWKGEFLAPQFGKEYKLPIPKAALFGKQTFELAVGESGTLTKVKYGKVNGANSALVVLNSAATELQRTDSERAQEANDEVNRIKAMTKLAKCKADPANC